jgi:hypothetical protein
MKIVKALIGGFAGAIALNILHETVKKLNPDAPRVDLVGEEALSKGLDAIGINPPTGDALYAATLAGDVISNGLYYTAIGFGSRKHLWTCAAVTGLTAGLGAIALPGPMGLDDKPVTRTDTTKVLTVGWYLFGALVTAAVLTKLQEKSI